MNINFYERIVKVILDVFDGVSKEDINYTTGFFTDGLDISSLDTVIFYLAIEDEFGVELPEDAYIRINNISDLIECLEESVN